jgi:hypothetical protein
LLAQSLGELELAQGAAPDLVRLGASGDGTNRCRRATEGTKPDADARVLRQALALVVDAALEPHTAAA